MESLWSRLIIFATIQSSSRRSTPRATRRTTIVSRRRLFQISSASGALLTQESLVEVGATRGTGCWTYTTQSAASTRGDARKRPCVTPRPLFRRMVSASVQVIAVGWFASITTMRRGVRARGDLSGFVEERPGLGTSGAVGVSVRLPVASRPGTKVIQSVGAKAAFRSVPRRTISMLTHSVCGQSLL